MMGGFYQRADCCGMWQGHGGEGCRNCPCPPPRQTSGPRRGPVYIGAPMGIEARADHIAEEAQGTGCWHVVRDRALHHLRELDALARRTPGRTDTSARREYGDDGGAGCVG